LKTKWNVIKHIVAKLTSVYSIMVLNLNKSGISLKDAFQNALNLYKQKHLKDIFFSFIHCWLILKDVPRWVKGKRGTPRNTPSMKHKAPLAMMEIE
jgi:hypothetical protein